MKKTILAGVSFLLALLVPASVFAAPKKKGGKGSDAEITCADVWAKKTKDFNGKTVKTFVLDVGSTGTVMSDAVAAVVPVETGDKSKRSGGDIYVLVPAKDFEAFAQKYSPDSDEASSSFGGKMEFKKLSAVFAVIGGENVLLVNLKASALKDFSPSQALEKQLLGDEVTTSSRDGFKKKIFNVSKMTKKNASEFKRLIALYNQGQKKADKVKEKDVREMCEDDEEYSLTVFDEKAKIEWLIRK
ncbi:MAG: hypothetical protein IJY80_01065 [Opitutales bacterium]|nr:hypothetical protein [Opitutales bacterium]MBQ9758975.1 hypothetical protein [Opitutales bacterium]